MRENCHRPKIGNVELKNPFVLAPLAGYTDKSMRTLCEEQGASLTFAEMVSGKGLKYGDRKTRKLLELTANETDSGLTAYQLFGNDPDILEFAARELADYDNVLLDLNCGCPVPKIVRNGEGSALLKRIDRLYDCVAAMVAGARWAARMNPESNAAAKPVTVKIRMGFVRDENVAVEAAKAIEAAGAAAITVHGRTREQYYEGKADWQVIASVKEAVRIPVIGNGDIRSGADAIRMMKETGCDGTMIARGALGNPWIFRDAIALWQAGWNPGEKLTLKEIGIAEPTRDEKIEMAVRHLEMVCTDKGEDIAVKEIRKFIGYYIKGMPGATAVRRATNTIKDRTSLVKALETLRQ